jgi:putative acyl-CoA dehydrogenase
MCLDVLGAVARGASGTGFAGLVEETRGLPGATEALAFIGEAFRSRLERVARLAVVALLAAVTALGKLSPSCQLFAATRLAGITPACGAVDLASDDVGHLLERALPLFSSSWPGQSASGSAQSAADDELRASSRQLLPHGRPKQT